MGTKLSTVKTRTTSSEEACIINVLPVNDNCCLVEEYDANLNRIRSKNIDLGFSSKSLALTRITKYEFILKGGTNAALVNLRTFYVQQMSAEYTKSITHSLGGHLLHHFPNEIRTTTRNMQNPVTLYQSTVHIKSLHVVNDSAFVFTNTAGFVYKVGVGITHSFRIYTDDVFYGYSVRHNILLLYIGEDIVEVQKDSKKVSRYALQPTEHLHNALEYQLCEKCTCIQVQIYYVAIKAQKLYLYNTNTKQTSQKYNLRNHLDEHCYYYMYRIAPYKVLVVAIGSIKVFLEVTIIQDKIEIKEQKEPGRWYFPFSTHWYQEPQVWKIDHLLQIGNHFYDIEFNW